MPLISHAIGRSSLAAAGAFIILSVVASAFAAGAALSGNDEARFLAENNNAMTKMMAGMSIKPSGDVDEDFVAMMVPHHQGAIDMAQAELRYGHNEQLRRIAQEIVVEQQQEIVAMRLALGQPCRRRRLRPTSRRPHRISLRAGTSDVAKSTCTLNMQQGAAMKHTSVLRHRARGLALAAAHHSHGLARRQGRCPIRTFRSATMTACTPPSNSPIRSPSSIPPTTTWSA